MLVWIQIIYSIQFICGQNGMKIHQIKNNKFWNGNFWLLLAQRSNIFQICINKNWISNVSLAGCKCSLLRRYVMAFFSNSIRSSLLGLARYSDGPLFGLKQNVDVFSPDPFLNLQSNSCSSRVIITNSSAFSGGKFNTHDMHLHSKW